MPHRLTRAAASTPEAHAKDTELGRWYALRTVTSLGFRRVAEAVPQQRPTGAPLKPRFRTERRFGEFAAVERIGLAGYEAFAPMFGVRVRTGPRRTKRWETRQVPLVPGYCFARLPDGVPWERFLAWSEIVDIVRMGAEPYAIPEAQIAALQALAEALDVDRAPRDRSRRRLRIGQRVEAHHPAWQGALGVIERIHRQNIVVLMELLGAPRRVTMQADELEVVG